MQSIQLVKPLDDYLLEVIFKSGDRRVFDVKPYLDRGLAGVHRTYVGSIERAERNVSIDNMEQLATALGLNIVDLLAPS